MISQEDEFGQKNGVKCNYFLHIEILSAHLTVACVYCGFIWFVSSPDVDEIFSLLAQPGGEIGADDLEATHKAYR